MRQTGVETPSSNCFRHQNKNWTNKLKVRDTFVD